MGAAIMVGVAGLWLALATPATAQSDENAGVSWRPIFDTQGSYAIGVVEIAPSNTRTIRVGTGENNAQRSVGFGDGPYKSSDGGVPDMMPMSPLPFSTTTSAALGQLRDTELRVEALERELGAQGVRHTPGSGVPTWPR